MEQRQLLVGMEPCQRWQGVHLEHVKEHLRGMVRASCHHIWVSVERTLEHMGRCRRMVLVVVVGRKLELVHVDHMDQMGDRMGLVEERMALVHRMGSMGHMDLVVVVGKLVDVRMDPMEHRMGQKLA